LPIDVFLHVTTVPAEAIADVAVSAMRTPTDTIANQTTFLRMMCLSIDKTFQGVYALPSFAVFASSRLLAASRAGACLLERARTGHLAFWQIFEPRQLAEREGEARFRRNGGFARTAVRPIHVELQDDEPRAVGRHRAHVKRAIRSVPGSAALCLGPRKHAAHLPEAHRRESAARHQRWQTDLPSQTIRARRRTRRTRSSAPGILRVSGPQAMLPGCGQAR